MTIKDNQRSFRIHLSATVANEVQHMKTSLYGKVTTDNKEIADGFCRFFAEISKRSKGSVFSSELLAQCGSTITIHVWQKS